jgi:hypothetical protein
MPKAVSVVTCVKCEHKFTLPFRVRNRRRLFQCNRCRPLPHLNDDFNIPSKPEIRQRAFSRCHSRVATKRRLEVMH